MGNNEIKEIIQTAANNCANLEFYEKFQMVENGRLMRALGFRGNHILNDEKIFFYENQSPTENELLRDLLVFIKPYLITGIITKTLDPNKL